MQKDSIAFCLKCGQRLEPGAAFCPNCGASVAAMAAETAAQKAAPRKPAASNVTFSFHDTPANQENRAPGGGNAPDPAVFKLREPARNATRPEDSGARRPDAGQAYSPPPAARGAQNSLGGRNKGTGAVRTAAPPPVRQRKNSGSGKKWAVGILSAIAILLAAFLALYLAGVVNLPVKKTPDPAGTASGTALAEKSGGKKTPAPDKDPKNEEPAAQEEERQAEPAEETPAQAQEEERQAEPAEETAPSAQEEERQAGPAEETPPSAQEEEHQEAPAEETAEPAASPQAPSLRFTSDGFTYYADMYYWIPGWYGVDAADYLQPEAVVRSAVWRSSDPAVAAVDGRGFVTFLNEGTAEITATVNGETASFSVHVDFRFTRLDYELIVSGSAPASYENPRRYHRAAPDSVSASSEISVSSVGTCFTAEMAVDGDTNTSWQEASPGDGVGEWIRLDYASPVTVSAITIWPGYWKRTDLFTNNGRPGSLLISFSEDECVIVDLEDTMRCGTIVLDQSVVTDSICIRILDVWPGDRWDDLAISEIAVYVPN